MNTTELLAIEYNIIRQEQLENEAIENGIKRYYRERQEWTLVDQKKNSSRVNPNGLPERLLLSQFIGVTSAAIEQWKTDVTTDKARKHALFIHILNEIDSDSTALIVLSALVNALGEHRKETSAIQHLANNTIAALIAEINYRRFKAQAPGYEYVMSNVFKKNSNLKHRKVLLNRCLAEAKIVPFTIDTRERGLLYNLLLDLVIQATGMCYIQLETIGFNKKRNRVVAVPELAEWLESAHAAEAQMKPDRLPMVCKPKPWVSVRDGGYLTPKLQSPILHTRDTRVLNELENSDMSTVFAAVNAIQETPWAINKNVLNVMQYCWDNGLPIAGLPRRDREDEPTKPHDFETNPEAKAAWKAAVRKTHDDNAALLGKRVNISRKLWSANKFKDEPAIYFPHRLDWRSRIYPMCGTGTLNPQSDDSGKALLQFANGIPLGESGGYWLCVHVANLFGYDKETMDNRVLWTMARQDEFLAVARDPIANQMWVDADKPWCALAAIYEFAGFIEQGDDYVSHLPIAMDGSNNGAQHLSAMGLDENAAVNLVPQEKPQDVYMEVAHVVTAKVSSMALEGDEDARFWEGKIVRKLMKQPVMTYVYGSTVTGMKDQIDNAAADLGYWDVVEFDDKHRQAKCMWLAKLIYPSIGEVMEAAAGIMAWLKSTASVVTSTGLPVTWTTPTGFTVTQAYWEQKVDKIDSMINGVGVVSSYRSNTDQIDRRKQAAGISPNYVHSMDASHLMMTVNAMKINGITDVAVIHDSYGCHAAHVDVMSYLIRQQFTNMYSTDVLNRFRDEIVAQLPDNLAKKILPVPAKGNLDINLVMESEFFFA